MFAPDTLLTDREGQGGGVVVNRGGSHEAFAVSLLHDGIIVNLGLLRKKRAVKAGHLVVKEFEASG